MDGASYGDPEYVPHVMRYYSGGSLFAGLFGNQQIVSVAMGQLGNSGGQKFWSWYGFDSRVEWCACFVSWCADQSGLIASGNVPKFSLCSDGVSWFQGKNKWQSGGTTPTAGMIIFFDWDHDGNSPSTELMSSTSELMSLVVCLISKGVETISPKGRMIATILLPLETSIPTAFINLSLLKIIAMDKCQFYSLPIQSTVV